MSDRIRKIGAFFLAVGVAVGAGLPADPSRAQSPYCGDSVALQFGETLSSVARKCGVSLGSLVDANRQIVNINAIRPGTIIYMPAAGGPPPQRDIAPPARAGNPYVVRPGDTLAGIARALGVSMAALIGVNPDIDARTLRIGQMVQVPASAGSPPNRPLPAVSTPYVVRPGDTLSRIAQVTGVSTAALLALNPEVDARWLTVGQVLRLTGSASPPGRQPPAAATQYVVRPGDTLSRIAQVTGVSTAALLALNPEVDGRSLRVGQVLRLTGSASPPDRQPPAAATQYVVRPGDTLSRIAQVTGVSTAALLALNPEVDARWLRVGQVLRLTGSGPIVGPRPALPQIALSPGSGPVGTEISLTGSNFPPNARLDILLGETANGLETIDQVRSDRRGRISALVEVPGWARRLDAIFIGVSAGRGTPTVSQSFRVENRRGDRDRDRDGLVVTGTLTRGGAECQSMRGDDGRLYSLVGELEDFRPGDRVRVRGRVAEISTCMSGTTIEVRRIRPAD